MKFRQILLTVAISAASALGSIALYNHFSNNKVAAIGSAQNGYPANYAGYFDGKNFTPADPIDFTKASSTAVPAVVHIKTKIPAKKISNDLPRRRSMLDDFFGDIFGDMGPNIVPEQRASGSGVIISEDGYIVTNNHVITNEANGNIADEITVTMHNRKTYKARVIGRDPSSDIAVLKIDDKNLPYLIYGNSDQIKLGQWVLAIGYPLTLETTVTAGIISATGRTININSRQTKRGDTPVESFIQTDAAVNQGNSGGALVNTDGQLIGINSAILAPTGTYAGYSFAIPVNIVKKIVGDIIQYGDVQRGYLGVSYIPTDGLNEEQVKSLGIPTNIDGVYVSDVSPDGGAFSAGLKKGDLITKVNNVSVTSGLQMSAQIAGFRPGDKVPVTYLRSGKESTVDVILKKKTDVVSNNIGTRLGGELATLDKAKAARYGIEGGVVVNKINTDGILARSRVQTGFIITGLVTNEGEHEVSSVEELGDALQNLVGSVRITGVYPGNPEPYTYPLNLGQ
ncbi:trypsin-like peptidase domain-containing protein [Flavisolibacter nicotianae]|uniref:trypsin-like peptidase domain-containing protein n=1 Tax=Flavisolibacter nicotianae TaxID=2364882 RepID=UPI000EB4EDFC|nr:trypsin-like peptidase domain-containing protein [Flavisolibacter nicotianae]